MLHATEVVMSSALSIIPMSIPERSLAMSSHSSSPIKEGHLQIFQWLFKVSILGLHSRYSKFD